MKVQRLAKENYDGIIGLMNYVFGLKNGREMNFEKELPKMCVRDDEHMRKHFGIFEDGKLVSCIGVYPFETVVYGEKMQFATMGNLVTHPDYEGRGYMTQVLERASQELSDLNIDVVRLGGLRSRYNRYGFEACGQTYRCTFTAKNRERKCLNYRDDIEFRSIACDDAEGIRIAVNLYNANEIAVPRTQENGYLSMTAWRNIPYLALRDGQPIGYLSANETGAYIAEIFSVDTQSFVEMVCAWQKRIGVEMYFSLQPHRIDKIRVFSAVCERVQVDTPSHFYIRNWEKVVNAFIKFKASYCDMVKGELCIGIEGYGTIRLFVDEKGAGCERTEKTPDITLSHLEASRYIFGPLPAVATAPASALAQAWLPLPLGWNGQDRV